MKITEEQRQEMLNAAKPLMQWLATNGHPHCEVHVDQTSATLMEGIATGDNTICHTCDGKGFHAR
jgi:hypothetical protein